MGTRIIKTSSEVKRENELKLENGKCPECGYKYNWGCYSSEVKGFFKMKRKNTYYVTCTKCGCEYEYDGEWENI